MITMGLCKIEADRQDGFTSSRQSWMTGECHMTTNLAEVAKPRGKQFVLGTPGIRSSERENNIGNF
jgi:hypothetical protein